MINDTEFGVPGLQPLWSNRNNKRKKKNTFNDETAPATSNSPQSTNHIISTNHQIGLASNYNSNLITPINKDEKKVAKKHGSIIQKLGRKIKENLFGDVHTAIVMNFSFHQIVQTKLKNTC